MKSKLLWLVFLCFSVFDLSAQFRNGEEILRQVHTTYFHGPCRIYSFSQHNFHYRNDSLIRTSEWHEAIEFPDKFRINFGDKTKGNYVLFRNDSVYNFREGKFLKARSDSNSLLLILGGMFYRNFSDVLTRLQRAGYKSTIFSEQIWKDKEVYVIGALINDSTSNQIWIDKKTLRVLRIIEKINPTDLMDMRFESHQAWCNGYVETKVSFRRNGKLEQVEEYYNIKTEDKFPEDQK